MNITYIDGSPKIKDSTSLYLLKTLESKMPEGYTSSWTNVRQYQTQSLLDLFEKSHGIVIAFPLYVDSIPSHLLQMLEEIQPLLSLTQKNIRLYIIVNCGFYDARQNHIDLSMMKVWCKKSGFIWGQGVAAGGGGMAQAAPAGHGPSVNLGKALDDLADNIINARTSDDLYFEPNFPRFLYKAAAHLGWISQAKKNNLKVKSLRNHHPLLTEKQQNLE